MGRIVRYEWWARSIYSRSFNVARSDIDGCQFDERAEFWTQCFIGDEVDPKTQEILQEKLNPEKSVRNCWLIEADENINIAVQVRGVARH